MSFDVDSSWEWGKRSRSASFFCWGEGGHGFSAKPHHRRILFLLLPFLNDGSNEKPYFCQVRNITLLDAYALGNDKIIIMQNKRNLSQKMLFIAQIHSKYTKHRFQEWKENETIRHNMALAVLFEFRCKNQTLSNPSICLLNKKVQWSDLYRCEA